MICYESISFSTNNRFLIHQSHLLLRVFHYSAACLDFPTHDCLSFPHLQTCWLLLVHNMSPIKHGGGVLRRKETSNRREILSQGGIVSSSFGPVISRLPYVQSRLAWDWVSASNLSFVLGDWGSHAFHFWRKKTTTSESVKGSEFRSWKCISSWHVISFPFWSHGYRLSQICNSWAALILRIRNPIPWQHVFCAWIMGTNMIFVIESCHNSCHTNSKRVPSLVSSGESEWQLIITWMSYLFLHLAKIMRPIMISTRESFEEIATSDPPSPFASPWISFSDEDPTSM